MKQSNAIIALALISACGTREERVASVTQNPATLPAVHVPDPIAKGVPHGSNITLLAVTGQGDAAITADATNGLRLWPALDGSRTPVPLPTSSQPEQLAIGHAGRDLLVIVRDTAGGVSLVRTGLDGTIRGRAQLPGGPVFEEAIAFEDGVLARTTDHVLGWFGPDGTPRGSLDIAHGDRIIDLASRRGRAAIVTSSEAGTYLRWLDVSDTLRFDMSIKLPGTTSPRADTLAIAPTRRRIAFLDEQHALHVFDTDLTAVPVRGTPLATNVGHHTLGFLDDARLAVVAHDVSWWTPETPPPPANANPDPWLVPSTGSTAPRTQPSMTAMEAAIGDHHVVTATHGSLALTDAERTRYLGWNDVGQGVLLPADDHIVVTFNSQRFTWLDENLASVHSINLQEKRGPGQHWMYGVPIGSHHMTTTTSSPAGGSELSLIDLQAPDKPIQIGRFQSLYRNDYADGILAVLDGTTLHRFKIDLATNKVEELKPTIRLPTTSVSWLRAFDPAKADGIAAISVGWNSDYAEYQTMTIYRVNGTKVAKESVKRFEAQLQRADADGTLYVLDHTKGTPAIQIMRGNKVLSRIERKSGLGPLAISRDGSRFATRDNLDVVVFDAKGNDLWRKQVWGVSLVSFAGDSHLVAAAPGGFIAFDAKTGEQRARECGWNFGLHEKPPEAFGLGFAPVCEDPIVQ